MREAWMVVALVLGLVPPAAHAQQVVDQTADTLRSWRVEADRIGQDVDGVVKRALSAFGGGPQHALPAARNSRAAPSLLAPTSAPNPPTAGAPRSLLPPGRDR